MLMMMLIEKEKKEKILEGIICTGEKTSNEEGELAKYHNLNIQSAKKKKRVAALDDGKRRL